MVHVPSLAAPAPPLAPLVAILVPPPVSPVAVHVPSSASLVTTPALPVAAQAAPPDAPVTVLVSGTSFVQFLLVTGKISFFCLNCPIL